LAFLEAVHAASPTMVVQLNCETEAYEFIDPSIQGYLGYSAAEMILSGPLFLASLLHPDDWAQTTGPQGALPFAGWNPADGEAILDEGEVRLKHRDGLWRWFHARRKVLDWKPDGMPRRILAIFQDITGRRHAEDRSIQAEERFRAVMEHSLDVINILDAHGNLIYSSPAGAGIHGFTTTGSLGLSLFAYVHPEELPVVRQVLAQLLASPERPRTVQYRLASSNRGWVWVEMVAINQLSNPAIQGILCNTRDISERKRAGESLLRSEALLAEAQHLAALGSFEFDLRTGASTWSEGMYRLLDRDPRLGPMSYKRLIALIHPDDRKLWTTARKRLYSDAVPLRYEFRVIWRDRSIHHLSIKARPVEVFDGSAQKIVGAIQDISELKRIEDALRESMDAYREAADLLPQSVFEMDATGRLTFINKQGFLAFGYTDEDFESGLQALQMLVPEDRVRAAQNISRAMTGERIGHEYEALRKDGSTFPGIIHSSPILRESRPVGLRGILVDITERKKAEEEREWLQERLRHSEKMEAIGQLAGGIAHDFNNHLSAILGFAEILLDRLEDPELIRFTDGIIKSSKRSAELTRQLLAFARKGKFLTVLVDLQDVIDEVVQILKHSIDKRILLKRVSDGSPALVLGDPYELQNALMNLAINARDAMPDGGELTFSTEVRELDEATCRRLPYDIFPGTFLQVSVTDTGVGIEQAIQQRIFEPFFTTKELGKGTGLGLASVYGTMKNHRGAVLVYSEPGRGSCFKLLLPLAELQDGEVVASKEARMEIQALGIPPGSKQVLLIEDEELVGQMLLVMLRHLGFRAVLVQDGLAAMEHFQSVWHEIDLVIMDLVMPHMSGLETFRALKAINPEVLVVVSSGYSVDGEAQRIMDEGAAAFLQKPYQIGELSHVLGRVFSLDLPR
jgi:two-component system cell cycle sensor histidine kinase/response regulator CckA